jgi:RNA polymerase sigma-70 factor (ECF subfamily)
MVSLSVPEENNHGEEKQQNIETEIQRLMDTYGNDVLRTACMILNDPHKAEDAFQEVFIRVYSKYGSFRGNSSEKTWITAVTMNVCRDMLRTSWLKRVFITDRLNEGKKVKGFEEKLIQKSENKLLFHEVISLPAAYKEVIILYYYQNYDTKEIGKILKIAEGTVRSRLHRAREILKAKLEGRVDFSQ